MSDLEENQVSAEESILSDTQDVSEEDKKDILKQIDKVVEDNKIPVTRDLFKLSPKKKGVFLPIFVNLFAAGIIVAGYLLTTWYFEQKKETLSTQAQSYQSAEGRLIAELKAESESKLKAKDGEIGKIQEELC